MKRKIPYLILLTTSLAGCVESIVMDPQEKDRPVVVNCILRGENLAYKAMDYTPTPQTQLMTIRYVKGKSDNEYTPVTDAEVSISYVSSSSQQKETLPFSYAGEGRWESNRPIVIEPESEYSLSIKIPGREPIWAKTVSAPRVYLNWVITKQHTDEQVLHSFRFRAARSQGETPEGREGVKGYSVWIYPQECVAGKWMDLDYIVTNNPYADDFNINNMKFSDLEIIGGPADYSTDYLVVHSPEERYINPFLWARSLAPDLPLHEKFVRIYNLDAENFFFLRGGPLWYVEIERFDTIPLRCICHFVSRDLDDYLRNSYIHDYSLDHFLTSLYSNANIYSNIHGGIGIFGSDCVSVNKQMLVLGPASN